VKEDLPVMKPQELIAALEKAGFELRRQTGSHAIMYKPGIRRPISIPQHPRDLPKGTVRAIIRETGLTRDEFLELL
jgi:predicted RNA binding protein YcfA (HicA-like mRNA interferase family)